MTLTSAGRYLRTIRHLRARQLVYQVRHRLRRNRRAPRTLAVTRPMPKPCWPEGISLPAPAANADHAVNPILAGVLAFQNRSEMIGFPPDWNITHMPHLWAYHLHYHEFLWSLDFAQARQVVLHWVANHRPGQRQVGWEPYPMSLRLVNWCGLFFGRYRAQTRADSALCATLWASIQEQANRLQRNLEWHLLGNHLFENAVALALVGSCFEHPDAKCWFATGLKVLKDELPEQILADGGHFERSPRYQCRILYDLLVLEACQDGTLKELVQPYTTRLAASLAALCHPDGEIALLNDSAFGFFPSPSHLIRLGGLGPPQFGTFALTASGYFGARTPDGHYVVCDAGPIGPDYQPAHGHADLFSFELSLQGTRVVVDSGVSTYEPGPMRTYCRSTAAHNTVEIEGQDQVELWAAFRVGRRCRPRDVAWRELPDGFALSGRHEGYRHLPGRPTHARTFRWQRRGKLDIFDRVDADRPLRCVARLHLHPECRISELGSEACIVTIPDGSVRVSWSGWMKAVEDESCYCPEFGIEIPNPCLALSNTVSSLRGAITIELP